MSARSGSPSVTVDAPGDRPRTATIWYDPDAAGFSDWPTIPGADPATAPERPPIHGPERVPGPAKPTPIRVAPATSRQADPAGTPASAATASVGELARLAMTDPVTGLGNRAALLAALSRRSGRSAAERPLVVVTIDLDGLRETNLRHGRAAGDELLRRYAARLAVTVRAGDTVTRTGGDEFVVLCDGSLEAGRAIAARLTGSPVERRATPTVEPALTASIGLTARRGRERASTLLRRADAAVRLARAKGRCQVVEAG